MEMQNFAKTSCVMNCERMRMEFVIMMTALVPLSMADGRYYLAFTAVIIIVFVARSRGIAFENRYYCYYYYYYSVNSWRNWFPLAY